MATPLNLEVLSSDFKQAGFPVKVMEYQDDGMFRFEFNYPNEKSATAMRYAMRKCGALVSTYYDIIEKDEIRGELVSRERALIPYEEGNHEDLRRFFINVIELYTKLMEERFGPQQESSYYATSRKRRALA